MKKFSDLGIKIETPMTGDKIKLSKVLNRLFILLDFNISDSKFQKGKSEKCLKIQIEIDGEKRIIFSGSSILICQIAQMSKSDLPVECTIIQVGEHYEFK